MLRALILKEWQENRWLITGFLVLAPILSLGMKIGIVGWAKTSPEDSMCVFLPGMLLLFLLAVGADLFAAESGSGRIAFLAALPVRPTKIWLAKGSFLVLSGVLFLGYLLAVEAAILGIGGKDPAGVVSSRSLGWAWRFVPVLTAGAAAFAFSTMLDRGLTVVLATLMTLGVFAGIGWILSGSGVLLEPEQPGFLPACGLFAAGFIAASWAPIALGRAHLGGRLRRVCCAVVGFIAILLPATTWAGVRTHQWLTLDVGDDDYWMGRAHVDPRGEWVVLRPYRPHNDAPSWITPPSALWAIRLRDGKILDLSPVANRFGEFVESRPGCVRVHLWRIDDRRWRRGGSGLRVEYDLEAEDLLSTTTGRIPRRPTKPGWRYDREFGLPVVNGKVLTRCVHTSGRSLVLPARWFPSGADRDWGTPVYDRRNDHAISQRYGWLDFSSNEVVRLSAKPTLVPRGKAEWAWGWEWPRRPDAKGWRVYRVSLRTGEARKIPDGPFRRPATSAHGGDWALLVGNTDLLWLQAGHPEPYPIDEVASKAMATDILCFQSTTPPFLYVTNGDKAVRITPTEAGPAVEQAPTTHCPWRPFWFDGGYWLEWDQGNCRLQYGRIGHWTRTLLPIDGEAR